tara:strand:- start:539 stop:1237 length:699 start_codon:yes stop_codon:yes gene_type:complete
MKKMLLMLIALPMIGFGQMNFKTYVPDDNFETYLEDNGMGDGILLNDSINTLSIEMLMYLDVSNRNIYDLTGIEDFTVLTFLDCGHNQLTSIDVSQNLYLQNFECSFNQITSLDVTNNIALTNLYCDDNQLTFLDLRNGNNTNIIEFFVSYNASLTCINVDDAIWSTANWTNIDPQHYFSNNCSTTDIEEHATKKGLLKITDLLGRETKENKNHVLFYLYDDGTVEKKVVIE